MSSQKSVAQAILDPNANPASSQSQSQRAIIEAIAEPKTSSAGGQSAQNIQLAGQEQTGSSKKLSQPAHAGSEDPLSDQGQKLGSQANIAAAPGNPNSTKLVATQAGSKQ